MRDSRTFIARSQADWEANVAYNFAILNTDEQTTLGSVGLNQINRNHNLANLGIWVRTSSTCRGVASAAIRMAAAFAFEQLGLNRVELLIASDNAPSLRAAEKGGAKCEGILRKRLLLGGRIHDACMYSLLRSDLG